MAKSGYRKPATKLSTDPRNVERRKRVNHDSFTVSYFHRYCCVAIWLCLSGRGVWVPSALRNKATDSVVQLPVACNAIVADGSGLRVGVHTDAVGRCRSWPAVTFLSAAPAPSSGASSARFGQPMLPSPSLTPCSTRRAASTVNSATASRPGRISTRPLPKKR